MNVCKNCRIDINKYHDLCHECYTNPEVMISHSEAKQKYKLTNDILEEQIEDHNIFYISFEVYHNVCYKYLRKDIHNIAKDIVKNLDRSDKRTKAFNRQDITMSKVIEKDNKIDERNNMITEILNSFLEKLDSSFNVNDYKKIINSINSCARNFDITPFIASNKILLDIQKIVDIENYQKNKKNKIQKLIEGCIDSKYILEAKKHKKYNEFICDGEIDKVDKYYDIIKKHVDDIKSRDDRIQKIDEYISNNIEKKYICFAKHHWKDEQYMDGNINFEQYVTFIQKDIDNKKNIESRKRKINYRIGKYISKGYQLIAKGLNLYNDYVLYDSNEVDIVIENIKKCINRVIELNKVMSAYKHDRYYEDYINGLISLDDMTMHVKTEIARSLARKQHNKQTKKIHHKNINNILGENKYGFHRIITKTDEYNAYESNTNNDNYLTIKDIVKRKDKTLSFINNLNVDHNDKNNIVNEHFSQISQYIIGDIEFDIVKDIILESIGDL